MAAPREPIHAPPLADIAARGGLVVGRNGAGPCPLCNAEHRGSADRRPPLAFFRGRDGGERWTCHACHVGGDAVSLLAAVRWREIPGRGDPRWPSLFDELRGEDAAAPMGAYLDRITRGHVPPRASRASPDGPPAPATRPPEPSPPIARPFLPSADVGALWAACAPLDVVAADRETERSRRAAVAWLERVRELPPGLIAAADMARVLPASYPWPWWVPRFVREVLADGPAAGVRPYALAVPVFDAAGKLRALRYRAVAVLPLLSGERIDLGIPKGRKAVASAADGEGLHGGPFAVVAGLVLADPMGRALLRGARADDGVTWDGRVVVTEGEPDTWTWATLQRRSRWAEEQAAAAREGRAWSPATWATFGVEAGAWTPELADRVPDGAELVIRVHHDEAGAKYAEAIRATVAGRCRVTRSKPTTGGADAEAT